jgi:hypothetical protein
MLYTQSSIYYRYEPNWRPYGYSRYGYGYGYGYPYGHGYGYPYGYTNLYTPYSPLPYLLPSDSLPYYLSQSQSLPPPPPTPLQIAYGMTY